MSEGQAESTLRAAASVGPSYNVNIAPFILEEKCSIFRHDLVDQWLIFSPILRPTDT